MRSFKLIGTASVVCLAFVASGCQEHSKLSLATVQSVVKADEARVENAVKSKEAEAKAAAERLDVYIGDKFSDEERALASKPADPDCPTF